MSLKFAAVVILFNPKLEHLNNIKTYMDYVEKVYVFDNTEDFDIVVKTKKKLSTYRNIEYINSNFNFGLPVALNKTSYLAINEGFDFLLTMDQDSHFNPTVLSCFIKEIENLKNTEDIATIGINFDREQKLNLNNTHVFKEKDYVITSGCFINLKNFEKIKFDENLFIDGVDIDYCFNALTKNLKNIQFENLYMVHELGETVYRASIVSLFIIKKNRLVHSYIRIYYMQRNLLYLKKKYKELIPNAFEKINLEYKDHISRCVKYSKNSVKALYYKYLGILDFKMNKMGRFNH